MEDLINLIEEKNRLEELINKTDDGIQVYSDAMIAKWQTEIEAVKSEIKKYSISKDGEIIKVYE